MSASTALQLAGELLELAGEAAALVDASRAANTTRAYTGAWSRWSTWCQARGLVDLPATPESVACYVADLVRGGRRVSTIELTLAAIASEHREAGLDTPTSSSLVQRTCKGARRRIGTRPEGRRALLLDELEQLVEPIGDRVIDIRDRALLLLGWQGAFRRSALVHLVRADLQRSAEGYTVRIVGDKTDPDRAGRTIGIPIARRPELCAVRALDRWLQLQLDAGPVFRSVNRHGQIGPALGDRAVALVVQRRARQAGLEAGTLAGHSLRAGFVTEMARRGVSERLIMRQTGHASVSTLRSYIRDGSIWLDNPLSVCL